MFENFGTAVTIVILFIILFCLFFRCLDKGCSDLDAELFDEQHLSSRLRRRNIADRQNNIELGRQNNRYGDIFFIEPNSQEAARIREQLEKDEKDLPSYDEVMRMCNLTTPTAAAAASPSVPTSPVVETGPIGIVALPAPPYSETDPNPSSIVVSPSALESAPSTSRAAQIPA
ncbi:uncharacterized protein LOC132789706 isoform X7 [Drosophila nasuta]|uniref:Uncharacterized protein LOC117570307 isoform X5 n=1 Tax=Drosophila albomicans TaxID=7291 RepID=A0A6P8X8W1_DROAB|nr:uncharacterized protein LOC117570307 isoform X5 [Drosophila albomicans]XP_060653893.1 uncharacterized protein LOC132789706 isoform X7 [Drosophila nasuta]